MEYGDFYIFVRSPISCSAVRKKVGGLIDDNGIAYRSNGNENGAWSAVDVASGLYVVKGCNTLNECVEKVNQLFEKITKMRNKDDYRDDVAWFESSPVEENSRRRSKNGTA